MVVELAGDGNDTTTDTESMFGSGAEDDVYDGGATSGSKRRLAYDAVDMEDDDRILMGGQRQSRLMADLPGREVQGQVPYR